MVTGLSTGSKSQWLLTEKVNPGNDTACSRLMKEGQIE